MNSPLFDIDFYKVGHVVQYPSDTEQVWSNFTPRSTRVPGAKGVVWFGMQYFIKAILGEAWNEHFFDRHLDEVLDTYRAVMKATLGVENPKTDHIERLHAHETLPIEIFSLPEGSFVPLRVPCCVVTNTEDWAYWLPNYIETQLSNILWMPSTSATTARRYREIFTKHALAFGHKDLGFIDWMGHDFSYRGLAGREAAILSGMGHLTQFNGTDTVPAIMAFDHYYSAGLGCGGSVPATEHSVMCAGLKGGEQETFRRLIEDVYPSGIVSVVSDTWDLWRVVSQYVPNLRDKILARDGKVVIRPDSGDPVNILCGDASASGPAAKGVLRILAEVMGTTDGLINKMAAIYGDSITPERAEAILFRCVTELKLSPFNCVFGIGSYTYQYVTRDTYGWAMKATAVQRGGKVMDIYKDPVTDNGEKKSACGIPAVYHDPFRGFHLVEGVKHDALYRCAFDLVYKDGALIKETNATEVRQRARQL
jgi:nicotinamide phosphoribosyltransferase